MAEWKIKLFSTEWKIKAFKLLQQWATWSKWMIKMNENFSHVLYDKRLFQVLSWSWTKHEKHRSSSQYGTKCYHAKVSKIINLALQNYSYLTRFCERYFVNSCNKRLLMHVRYEFISVVYRKLLYFKPKLNFL